MKLMRKLGAVLGVLLICVSGAAFAQTNLKTSDFQLISPPRPVATGERIEVIEFFYYGCPVCYEFQPHLSRWLVQGPNYISIRRVPTLPSEGSEGLEGWVRFARLYYTLEALGQIARLHWPIYDNFHFDGIKLNDEKIMLDWITRNKVDVQKFTEAFNAETTKTKVESARKLLHDFNIRGVPTLIVDGKFVTSARLAGGTRQIPSVLNQLVEIARKERGN